MNYAPQTRWVGGYYPGATPKHLHEEAPKVGHKYRAIVAYVKAHGPVSAVTIAKDLGMPLDSVRGQLRTACVEKDVDKTARLHPNRRNRINFYMEKKT